MTKRLSTSSHIPNEFKTTYNQDTAQRQSVSKKKITNFRDFKVETFDFFLWLDSPIWAWASSFRQGFMITHI